jgi:alkylation response protein AidB-like acyl-CoA dehydrogenase
MLDSTSGADALVVEMAQRFAQDRLSPHAAAREKAGAIEADIIAEMGELGFLGATTPAAWGGSEIDAVTYALMLE